MAVTNAAPPDAGQLLNQQRPALPQPTEQTPQVAEEIRPSLQASGSARVRVRSIRFTGFDGLATQAELEAQTQAAIGHELTFNELTHLAERVTRFLKDQGWMLARAYLPQQDVTEGDVEIVVLRGRIEGALDGSGILIDASRARIEPVRVRKTLARALDADADALRSRDLERGLLLLNDLPGVRARAALERGSVADSTRLSVQVLEGAPFTGVAFADTHNNRYTGSARAGVQMAWNDPSRRGDQATLAASVAEHMKLGQFGYSMPMGYSGMRADVSYSALNYSIGKALSDLDAEGSARTAGVGVAYPHVRSRKLNLWTRAGYERKALEDELLGHPAHDKRVNAFTAAITGDAFDAFFSGGVTSFALNFTTGDLDLSRVAVDAQGDALTAKSADGYSTLGFEFSRVQRLSDAVSLFVSFTGQFADQNLDSSEEFMLGGASGVRAYPVGEASGDEGWLANLELRYELAAFSLGQVQLVTFLDTGHITLNHTPWGAAGNADNRNSYGLTGSGLGLNLSIPGRGVIRTAWATSVGSNPGRSLSGENANGTKDGSHFWLQAQYGF